MPLHKKVFKLKLSVNAINETCMVEVLYFNAFTGVEVFKSCVSLPITKTYVPTSMVGFFLKYTHLRTQVARGHAP